MRSRQVGMLIVAVALLVAAVRHPSAEINILTADAADRTPHQVKAAVDLGVVAFRLLITWTAKGLT
jgi:hypothetical protein